MARRLKQVMKELNVGLDTINDFIVKECNIADWKCNLGNPVSDNIYSLLVKKFPVAENQKYTDISCAKTKRTIIGTELERQIKDPTYYIIDTNVFVDCPDILSKIYRTNQIVLSAKVVDELDKLKIKLPVKERQRVEKALLSLNRGVYKNITFEWADVSILPDDLDKKSPDNLILSVALRYKDDKLILLTSDNGLQLKAKMLGIRSMSLQAFLHSRQDKPVIEEKVVRKEYIV